MTILELQNQIKDRLNAVEALVQGGCKAFAEDSLTITFDIAKALNEGAVTLIILTPEITRDGSGVTGGLPVGMTLEIQATERVALNRSRAGAITALDAALLVARALDGDEFEFLSIREFADAQTKTLTAGVRFNFSTVL